jgi:hypothetical protein
LSDNSLAFSRKLHHTVVQLEKNLTDLGIKPITSRGCQVFCVNSVDLGVVAGWVGPPLGRPVWVRFVSESGAAGRVWRGVGRGSSVLDGVPVLATVKPGWSGAVGARVDRGCAPAKGGWSGRNPAR